MARSKNDRDPKAVALGRRIAAAMEQKGYKQEELASMLGVTKGAVGQWAIGATTPRPKVIPKLVEALGVTMRWLLTGDEPEEQIRAQTEAQRKLLAETLDLTPAQQETALALVLAYKVGLTKK